MAPWHWGHNGYNGSAFSQAAKNSLRFGHAGQASYYFGWEPPPAVEIYTHHPLLLHGHLVASFSLFGAHEWSARLVPFFYSLATWLLLVVAVNRFWRERTALFAGLAYALTPVTLTFANMVDHEQGGIFFSLLLVYAYLRWLETGTRSYAILSGLAVTCATQFDWPGYYVAFAVAAHCLLYGVRGRAPARWSVFLALFSALTLLNFGFFFLWIHETRGGLGHMVDAFQLRNQVIPISDYLRLVWFRLYELYGPLLLGIAAVGSVVGLRNARKSGLQARALLPLAFGFAGIVHIAAFPNAMQLHAYWVYYWAPATAVGAAVGLDASVTWVKSFLSRRARRDFSEKGLAATVFVVFAFAQGSFAVVSWLDQLERGHASDCEDCYFQRLERAWFVDLGNRFDDPYIRFAIHRSVQEPRIELRYYLDAPHREGAGLRGNRRNAILLVDRTKVREERQRLMDWRLRRHPHWVWMNRFYAIDLRRVGVSTATHYDPIEYDPSLAQWWLTTQNSDRPIRWKQSQ